MVQPALDPSYVRIPVPILAVDAVDCAGAPLTGTCESFRERSDMTSPVIILAIPGLAVLVLLWTIWRCAIRQPRPSSAPLERLFGVAAIFLLWAASSALNFTDR